MQHGCVTRVLNKHLIRHTSALDKLFTQGYWRLSVMIHLHRKLLVICTAEQGAHDRGG